MGHFFLSPKGSFSSENLGGSVFSFFFGDLLSVLTGGFHGVASSSFFWRCILICRTGWVSFWRRIGEDQLLFPSSFLWTCCHF